MTAPAAIGFVGLGQMGRPMVANLARAGFEVLAFDRSPEACAALAPVPGVRIADDALAVAAACPTVILMLSDSRVVDALL